MWQGTRTRHRSASGRITGALAVAGIAAIITIDIARDGLAWQAGPLHVSMDIRAERGLAISFQRPAPRLATGFAGQPDIGLDQRG